MRVSAGAEEGVPLFAGRLGLQQRVLPAYRAAFFESLATACREGFSLFAGYPMPGEAIRSADSLAAGLWVRARNIHFFRGPFYLCWQRGLLGWLRDWNPDALILEANPRYLSNWLALNWMKARGRPVLGWALGAGSLCGIAPSGYCLWAGSSGANAWICSSKLLHASSRARKLPWLVRGRLGTNSGAWRPASTLGRPSWARSMGVNWRPCTTGLTCSSCPEREGLRFKRPFAMGFP